MRLTDNKRLIHDNQLYDTHKRIAKHTTIETRTAIIRSVEAHVFPRYWGQEAGHTLRQVIELTERMSRETD